MTKQLSAGKVAVMAGALVAFGIAARLLPHWPDMTPITAIILAGSLYLGTRWSLPLALVTMLASDALIGFYDWHTMLVVYGSFALIGLAGPLFARSRGVWKKGAVVVGTSLFFFLTTNAAVWAFSPLYAHTLAGLMASYAAGLPFLRNMLVGDLVYTGVLVGALASVAARMGVAARGAERRAYAG